MREARPRREQAARERTLDVARLAQPTCHPERSEGYGPSASRQRRGQGASAAPPRIRARASLRRAPAESVRRLGDRCLGRECGVILGTAGHIDHGKTTLVKALTGGATDRLPEEKRRGITIDLGFAPLQLEGVGTVGVVDVPGHEAFVRTMVAGATGIDMALVVIAADEGIMPQTREHVAILEHLAVPRGVVALTKRDMVEEDWLDLVRADVIALLAETRLANAPVVPVSATTVDGITDLRAALISLTRDVPEKQVNDLFRLPIDRVFTVKGTGTVVTGTVWSGELADGATIRLLPQGREVRVRGLQNHSRSVPSIRAGDRAAIALAGIDVDDVSRGTVVVSDPTWEATRTLRADVVLTDAVGPRTRVRFHVGTSEVGARLHVITSAGPP